MTLTELEIILQEGESYKVEFKESIDKSLVEEVCALPMHLGDGCL